jgi:hypothetical protein
MVIAWIMSHSSRFAITWSLCFVEGSEKGTASYHSRAEKYPESVTSFVLTLSVARVHMVAFTDVIEYGDLKTDIIMVGDLYV